MRVMKFVGALLLAVGLLGGCGGTEPAAEALDPLATREDAINQCNDYAPQGSSCTNGVCVYYPGYTRAPACRPICKVPVGAACPEGGRCCPGFMGAYGQTANYCLPTHLACEPTGDGPIEEVE